MSGKSRYNRRRTHPGRRRAAATRQQPPGFLGWGGGRDGVLDNLHDVRETRTRPPFSPEWIRNKLLAPGALSGLNDEARGLLLGMVNTGYRPSEGAGLTAKTIRLDAAVPHIAIEPEGRQLKSAYARRVIPLTGVSLEAFKAFPDGFPRYRESSAGLGAKARASMGRGWAT